jgi:hypothetical protein|tara:strand:- start:751 stop:1122 length:372 start_codon:yes stop_codon:yes gene_type:complete
MPYIVGTQPVTKQTLLLSAGLVDSTISTTTSVGISTLVSIASTDFRSVNYQIQVVQGTNYNATSINLIHDGTNAYITEYGTLNQPTGIATFSADIDSDKIRLLGYPGTASTTTFKVIFAAVKT